MVQYVLNRLREPSTWRGVVYLLTAAGVAISPEQGQHIIAVGMAIAGAIAAFIPDRFKK